MGFACKGVKAVDETGKPVTDVLSKVPKPAIAHIINAKGLPHFVVIYQVEKGKFLNSSGICGAWVFDRK